MNTLISAAYEALTGTPWTTVRSATAEFGPPPGAVHAEELSRFSDYELVARHNEIRARLAAGMAHTSTTY